MAMLSNQIISGQKPARYQYYRPNIRRFLTSETMFEVIFLLSLCVLSHSSPVVFEDCGSAYELMSVDIYGCGTRLPCLITLGEIIPVSIRFQAEFESRNLNQDVVININYVNLRAQATPEPCASIHCPVSTSEDNALTSMMTVPTSMALNQRGYLQWRVFNENSRQVLCYSVLVQTQSTLQKLMRQSTAINATGKINANSQNDT